MSVTFAPMHKKTTIQIRFPVDLGADIALVAAALGKSVPEWAEEVMRAAVASNMPRVKKIVDQKAMKGGKRSSPAGDAAPGDED